jgi:hypothetical protein
MLNKTTQDGVYISELGDSVRLEWSGSVTERKQNMKAVPVVVAVVVAVVLVAMWSVPAPAQEYNYEGVQGCKACHSTEKSGKQFQIWEANKHSKAYATLAGDEAKKIGQTKGIANPQESPDCLKCHVTGYGLPATRFEATYKKEDGVGCEACHGPGSGYKKMQIMKNRDEAIKNGLIIPTEDTCKKCHNQESPTFKGFNFAEMSKKIAHPTPKAAQ